MRGSFAFASVSLLSGASLASAGRQCKCMPGDACFPTDDEWSTFGQSLSSPEALVQKQRPLGAICYPNDPLYNADACTALNATLSGNSFEFMSSQIDATNYYNLDSIVTSNATIGCPYFPIADNTTCEQGRVPPYAVNVSSTQDIVEAVKFATEHNLRLVVKNTGHEQMGRAFGAGALEIFTHNLQNITFNENFVPEGAPEGTESEYAMIMAPGVDWRQAYDAADEQGRQVVGGLSPMGTVGAAAGWQLGTGHSVIAPFYGLGVDNSLQFTVVLPNASVVTTNKYTYPDLFWALRGGGGPSFGIVVETIVRTHESIPYTGAFFTGTGNSTDSYTALLATWMKYHNNISDAGWGGVWPFTEQTLFLTFAAQGTPTRQEANDTMEAFFAEAATIPGVTISVATTHYYDSFGQFVTDNLVNSSNAIGFNYTQSVPGAYQSGASSWLLPREVTAPENAETFAKIMANTSSTGLPFFVGGGKVAEGDNSTSAANPAWRRTITDMTLVGSGFATTNTSLIYEQLHIDILPYRELAPPPYGGQYLNEADILEEEWQAAQWGDLYERLLAIKKEVDPNDLLIVSKGVNSEAWDAEIICKTV